MASARGRAVPRELARTRRRTRGAGRSAAMKALLLAGDDASAMPRAGRSTPARRRPSRRSAGTRRTLALLVLRPRRRGARARGDAASAATTSRATSPTRSRASPVATAMGYAVAIENVLESFETRTDFLEDVAVADTVLVLQVLAAARGIGGRPAAVAAASALSSVAAAAASSTATSCRSRARTRLPGVARDGSPANARAAASALSAPATRNSTSSRGAEHRQRQRDAVDERLELRLRADRAPVGHVERRLVGIERGHVPVGAEAEQHEVEALQRRRAPRRTRAAPASGPSSPRMRWTFAGCTATRSISATRARW